MYLKIKNGVYFLFGFERFSVAVTGTLYILSVRDPFWICIVVCC